VADHPEHRCRYEERDQDHPQTVGAHETEDNLDFLVSGG
jgi:hypothetical protein